MSERAAIPLRVLIVEDSEDDARLLLRHLERAGYEVTSLRVDSEAAMATAIATRAWDIVVSDYSLPGFSGLAAIALCQSRGLDLPFVMVSGAVGEEIVVQSMKAGAHDYVMKGNLTRLGPAVERELREAEERRERRRAQEALRQSEEKYRALYDDNPTMYFTVDAGGTILSVNRFGATQLGYTVEELVGRPVLCVLPPEEHERVRQEIEACLRAPDQVHHWELSKVRKDGGILWVKEAGKAVRGTDGRPVVLIVCEDVSQRRHAEQRLVELAAALEQAADDIIVTDPEGAIQYVNAAFERVTGYSRDEVIGRPLITMRDEDLHRGMPDALPAGQTWQGRITTRTKSGQSILQDASISAIRDSSGRIAGHVIARRDVTRQAEMEARAAQAEKLEAIGTLASGIAHDFNNILNAIIGYADLALMKCPPDSPIYQDLEAVLQASGRATALVKQILTFSRRTQQEVKPVQVSLVVREALKFMRASVPSTIEIRQNLSSDGIALADPTEVHRIVVNLCTNAALAMRDRGGVLDVSLDEVDLDAAFAAGHPGVMPGPFLRLRVRDTGCGMSREVMAHIFEPFFTTRRNNEGTGMGLAVVHGIVASHRGAVTVESEPGRGTTFDVFLPAVERELPPPTHEPQRPLGGTERVLFVDDEPVVTRLVSDALGMLGYRVRTRTNGLEALAAFKADPDAVDIVVTDMTMPGMTGDELARQLKRMRPDLPVILCTGFSEKISAESALAQGIDEFVMKPILLADLSRLIRKVLDRD